MVWFGLDWIVDWLGRLVDKVDCVFWLVRLGSWLIGWSVGWFGRLID